MLRWPKRKPDSTSDADARVAEVRRRLPKGHQLPARFDDFVRANPPFSVQWTDLEDYELNPTAMEEAVPFLELPDGGLIALWYHAPSPAVIHIGGHGELQVIAHDFDDFLIALAAKRSGLPDFDDARQAFRVPGVTGEPMRAQLPALQEKLEAWFSKHTSLQAPVDTPDAEALRQRVCQIVEQMLRDGCSKVYTPRSPSWSVDFKLERSDAGFVITYLDFGAWYPLPEKYKLAGEVVRLLELVKHKDHNRYELSVCSAGIVSIDRDRELVLVPPA